MSWRAVSRSIGELLLTVGLVLLLFTGYELYGTGLSTSRAQGELREQLADQWRRPLGEVRADSAAAAPARPVPGDAVALLHLPTLWDEPKVLVEGVDRESLKKGPGRQPGTALPGELGNLVLAGHRTTYGAPFGRLDELATGDVVVVQTRERELTYTLRSTEVVDPSDVAVTLPVPRQPGVAPTEALVTLITCTPKYSARQRLILTGVLTGDRPLS